jgi:hypothetical protein
MAFVDDAIKDLLQLKDLVPMSPCLLEKTKQIIRDKAEDHEHMKTADFVDMCIMESRI